MKDESEDRMDRKAIDKGKLLYVEKGNQRLHGFYMLIFAFLLSIIYFLLFYTILLVLDSVILDYDVLDNLWWVLLLAFFMVPSIAYVYSIAIIIIGEGPLKIYDNGIETRHSNFLHSNRNLTFIPFESIKKITPAYSGWDRHIYKENLNQITLSGVRIRTEDGDYYDITLNHFSIKQIKYQHFFHYEIIQILMKILGSKWNKLFSIKPDIREDEWEDLLKSSKTSFTTREGYGLKQSLILTLLYIPAFGVLILMFLDVLNGLPLIVALIVTVLIAFVYVPFSSYKIINYLHEIFNDLGNIFRAQEYEMISGEKIIPIDVVIPDEYQYYEKNWPNLNEEYWEKLKNYISSKSKLDAWQYSLAYKIILSTKFKKFLRYERLTGKKIIPDHIRNMEKVRPYIEEKIEEYDTFSKRKADSKQKLKEIERMFDNMELGHPIPSEIDFKTYCFKQYGTI